MRKFNITVNGRTYEVEVEEVTSRGASTAAVPSVKAEIPVEAPQESVVERKVTGEPKKEEIEKKVDVEAPSKAETAADTPVPSGAEVISSPMPGTILSVNVKAGDLVKRGDVLLILEAMKMENEIMASRDGKVLKIGVQSGASVNTGDLLAVIS